MNQFLTLAAIPFLRLRNVIRRPDRWSWGRAIGIGLIALIILSMVFGLLRLVFRYFIGQPVIGPLLVSRMFSMAFMTFLFMLVYSNIMSSLSSHYLGRDLALLMSSPVRPLWIWAAKAVEAVTGSSWMVVMMCVPLLGAYANVRGVPWTFVPLAVLAIVPFLLIPAAIALAATCAMMRAFPASRLRETMLLIGTIMFTGAVVAFRLLEPEKMVNPQDEMAVFEYMKLLAGPSAPWLPSGWVARAIVTAGRVDADPLAYWGNVARLWTAAGVAWGLALAVADATYRGGWQHACESMGVKRGIRLATRWLPVRTGAYAAVLLKDAKVFVREPSQWGQILLLGSLVLIYVFNLTRIPGDLVVGLKSILFFLNLGFIGLILAAVGARFLFPLVSLEGKSIELLRTAPIRMERYLWTRLLGGIAPLVILGLALVAASVRILEVDGFMAAVATGTVLALTAGIGALAIGCGAGFARFRVSNPEEIVTSAGGFAFMILATGFIAALVAIEAQPVHQYYRAALFRRPFQSYGFATLMFGAALALTAAVTWASVRLGARSLERRDLH